MLSDEEVLERLPGIRIDHDNKAYYRGLLEHRLLLNRCSACGAWHHPPKPSCPKCWSWEVTPTEVEGRGQVYLFSFLNGQPAHDDPSQPFPVASIELAEGVRFTSTIVDCPKHELAIGLPVELTWIERDGMPFPAFRPSRG